MGNTGSKAVKNARQLKPYKFHEIEELNSIAEREQARLKELATAQEIAEKDEGFGDLLSKLSGSVNAQKVVVSGKKLPEPAKTSKAPLNEQDLIRQRLSALRNDDEPGRIQTSVIREVLEARTFNDIHQTPTDLKYFERLYGVDPSKLERLMKHACLPVVGRLPMLNHEYAFARLPLWFRETTSGLTFVSEPDLPSNKHRRTNAPAAVARTSDDRNSIAEASDAGNEPEKTAAKKPQAGGARSFQQLFGSDEMAQAGKKGDDRRSDDINAMLRRAVAEANATQNSKDK